MDDPSILEAACLDEFVAHGSTYYNRLLHDLDERTVPDVPISKPYNVVPPLLLKRSMQTPRARHSTRIGFSRPGTSRTTPEELQRREDNRIELLCHIEGLKAYAHMTTTTRPMVLSARARSRGITLKIEQELIDPYRRNEAKYEALLQRVEKIEKKRDMAEAKSPRRKKEYGKKKSKSFTMARSPRKTMISPRAKPIERDNVDDNDNNDEDDEGEDEEDQFDDMVDLKNEKELRRQTVLFRRNTLLESESESVRRASAQWSSKIISLEDKTKYVSLQSKAMKWITIVNTVNKMKIIGNMVKQFRQIKSGNLVVWNACRTIQRYWRKFCPSNRGFKEKKSFIHMFRKSMGTRATKQLELFHARCRAATMITHFLSSKGFKVAVLQFLQRVRRLQRKIRDHLCANKARCDVLNKLMDHCIPALLVHIHIVAAGRGYDVNNINSFEENQIHKFHKFRMCRDMQTPAFHQFLRRNLHRFGLLSKDLLVTTMANNKSYVDNYIKKPILLDYIFKRRRQFSLKFNSQLRIDIDIPKVTLNDVRLFIRDGVDPITNSLWALAKKEKEMLDDYYNRKSKATRVLKVNEKMVINQMAFYKEATVMEITLLIISIFEKANTALYPAMMNLHHLTALAASGGVNVTSSVLKRQSVMAIDPRREREIAATAHYNPTVIETIQETPPTSAGGVMTSSAPLTHRRPSSVSIHSGSNSQNNSGDHSHLIGRRPSSTEVQLNRRPSTDNPSIKAGLKLGYVPEGSRGTIRKSSVMLAGGREGVTHKGFQPSLPTVSDTDFKPMPPSSSPSTGSPKFGRPTRKYMN